MFEIVGREEQKFNQWEQGVKLSNPCMKAGDEVVFRNSSGATYVMIAQGDGVEVPNKLLQMTCNILVDLKQGNEQHDDCQTVFEVNPAEKPDDYVYVDNTIRKQDVQSGGSGEMVVIITPDENMENFAVDKTFDEVLSAHNSGMKLRAELRFPYGTYFLPFVYVEPDGQISFACASAQGITSLTMFKDGGGNQVELIPFG